jgi:uncharacterized OB-fold protein
MAKKFFTPKPIIDKETLRQQKIMEQICTECGKEALCGKGFCHDCKVQMRITMFNPEPKH